MKDDFLNGLKQTILEDFNVSVTENGAAGYKTTGKEIVDLTYSVSSLRNASAEEIVSLFIKAFFEDKLLAVKWLFYVGDVRGGMGERRLFRIVMRYLAVNHPQIALCVLPLIPEYTRWDNCLVLLDSPLEDEVCAFLKNQIDADIKNMKEGKPVSLCAKWLPSVNASSAETVAAAKKLIKKFGISERDYRKTLALLRKHIDVVEVKMSAREWDKIDYSTVPSGANLLYSDAFLRNDEQRRTEYLSKLSKGETKINSGVLFPHNIVHKYTVQDYYSRAAGTFDTALEEMWKALPDYVKGAGNTICVADGSGSMLSRVGGTEVSALDVANSLAIYFAERSTGLFKDKYITFSERPKLVDFSKCKSLHDKIELALSHDEIANTNIEAVFDLILKTAVKLRMQQSDMPENILILSDMEFDYAVIGNPLATLFDTIAERYDKCGYKLPRLTFWNILSRTKTLPVIKNDLGVTLVSGFSPTALNMVLSGKTDPYDCIMEQLNAPRYDAVEKALAEIK